MESTKKFAKNDRGFKCVCCGEEVQPLKVTSRDHCPICLTSLHVDINPGDRANKCKGQLIPVSVETSNKKGYIINYQCSSCGMPHNNKAAPDDDFEMIIAAMNRTYGSRLEELLSKKKTINSKKTTGDKCEEVQMW